MQSGQVFLVNRLLEDDNIAAEALVSRENTKSVTVGTILFLVAHR